MSESKPAFEAFGNDEASCLTGVRQLVDRFYDEMDTNPTYQRIRQLHPSDLTESRNKFYWFLSGWLGGPDLYTDKFGHPRLRMRHMPFPIATEDRDQWLLCMATALKQMAFDETFIEQLMVSFFRTADWMRNTQDNQSDKASL